MRRFRWDNLKIAAAGVALLVILGLVLALRDNTRLISGEQLKVLMRKQLVTRVVLDEPYLYVRTARMRYKVPARGIDLAEVADRYPLEVRGSHPLAWLTALLGLLALGGGALWLLRRRQGSEPGSLVEGEPLRESASAETVAPTRSTVRFRDVAGMEDVKADLAEIIDFLRHPGKYRKLDVRLPKGVLLAGPPGVGKTWLAKAVAGEAGVPFFYQSGANIVEIYVGMGAKRVHELFQAAKRQAPAIVFIDEIDAVGKSRGEGRNDEREATLNQLLTEMDGFESGSGVIVMAATNRIEMLDPALLRPGRFDRRIHISLPDERERRAILELYLRKKPHALDLDRLAHLTVGFSPAALSTLVNEAALHALRRGSKRLEDADFEAVIEAVVSGKRKILSFSEEERRIQAVYQSAKALVATWYDVPFEKIGIVTTRLEETEREILSRGDLLARIKVRLAGPIATREVLGERYSNAAEDLARARREAQSVIFDYGMGEGMLPSQEEVESLLAELFEETAAMLRKLESARKAIEEHLLRHENIDPLQAREILRALF